MQATKRPDHYRFQLGEMTVATVLDGYAHRDGPRPTFGANASEEEMADLLRQNFLPNGRYENHFVPVVVETGGEVVVFDTGFSPGSNPTAGHLQARLAHLGLAPEDVSLVVVTHGHGDHISGIMTEGRPSFPNARYAIAETEWDFWTSDRPAQAGRGDNAQMFQSNVVPLRDRTTFLKDGDTVAPGITAMAAPGHTPGHTIFMLESGGRQLLHFVDVSNHYVASLARPDWHVAFDFDKEQAVQTRKRVLDMVATDRIPAIGYHMPFPSVGFVERAAGGYRWVAASYQMNL
ncbi:MBL fold metallo-hydrolase [Lutibaculum baratangense]|uniref:Metallo-beta-lactamase superfamily protein n=1 Tax=Lutibaculum baratangense AMV1 TaxID=631454 RepID=V4RHG5_9HYPH|nr:MBL fold metallo-hydrolase [Lutibaculum baratangense]ESR24794.1 metallo-beta-lactamase superfamily protein [Lutibaculum baratangense AMV1]